MKMLHVKIIFFPPTEKNPVFNPDYGAYRSEWSTAMVIKQQLQVTNLAAILRGC